MKTFLKFAPNTHTHVKKIREFKTIFTIEAIRHQNS